MRQFGFSFIAIIFFQLATSQNKDSTIINPIPIDKEALSGLNLKPVVNAEQPERKLFQKNLFIGKEIGVFIVASETADADWENYSVDEFIFVLNGRARLHPKGSKQVYFNKGDFFVAPKGYKGVWETQGGKSFYHELAVVALNRIKTDNASGKLPVIISKEKLDGIGISKNKEDGYNDLLFEGIDLTVTAKSEKPLLKQINTKKEQLIYVLAGKVTLTSHSKKEHTFYTNEFFVLPKGFTGTWKSEGHELFRSLHVAKTK